MPRTPKGVRLGGRQKGTPNKRTFEVGARCRAMVESPEYLEDFTRRLRAGQLPPMLEALTWHYAYGKPTERHELTGLSGGPLVLSWKS